MLANAVRPYGVGGSTVMWDEPRRRDEGIPPYGGIVYHVLALVYILLLLTRSATPAYAIGLTAAM